MPRSIVLAAWLAALAGAPALAQSDYAARDDARALAREIEDTHGIPAAEVLETLAGAQALPRVIDLIKPPADPRVRSWQRYRARTLADTRIDGGLRFWDEHAEPLAQAQARFGVPAEVIVAIIGVETVYGRITGSFETLSALATLAFDYPPRAELFRRELGALFALAREQRRPVASYRGSYAGALGIPQFLPSSWRSYGIDFDGDGRAELDRSAADAIGSVANFLREHGWVPDAPVAVRAAVTGDAGEALAAGIAPSWSAPDLARFGVYPVGEVPAGELCALVDLVTPDAPTEYWLGLQNFYVITRYNRSSFYAMSVHQLAQTLQQKRQAKLARR